MNTYSISLVSRYRRPNSVVSRFSRFTTRRGVTLIELIIVIAVVSLILGLILPAIQAAREAARSTECKSKLRQIGIALENFHAARGKLPGSPVSAALPNGRSLSTNISCHVELLPYLDQRTLYDQFDRSETGLGISQDPPSSKSNGPLLSVGLAVFSCPADSGSAPNCNYRISCGTSPWMHETLPKTAKSALQGYRSLFGRHDQEFLDGKSHTAAFAEKLAGDRDSGRYTPWRDLASIRTLPAGISTPDDAVRACERPMPAQPKHFSFGGTTWVLSGYPQTWYNHVLTPNSSTPDCVDGGPMGHGAFTVRSLHTGGANVLFADGSNRFVASAIDLDVWRAFGSIAGGEVVSD